MNAPSDIEERIAALEASLRRVEARLSEFTRGEAQRIPRAVDTPTASSPTRRQIYVTQGGPGVADTCSIILKDAADVFSAVQIAP